MCVLLYNFIYKKYTFSKYFKNKPITMNNNANMTLAGLSFVLKLIKIITLATRFSCENSLYVFEVFHWFYLFNFLIDNFIVLHELFFTCKKVSLETFGWVLNTPLPFATIFEETVDKF